MAFIGDGIMKKETKRFYEFTFEQLIKMLKLEGGFVTFDVLDKDGVQTGLLKIITVVREDVK